MKTEEIKFKKGDKAVMFDCMEANHEKNYGKIWECTCDSYFTNGNEVVFLKGVSGYFSCKYLQLIKIESLQEQPKEKCEGCKRAEGSDTINTCTCDVEQPKSVGGLSKEKILRNNLTSEQLDWLDEDKRNLNFILDSMQQYANQSLPTEVDVMNLCSYSDITKRKLWEQGAEDILTNLKKH